MLTLTCLLFAFFSGGAFAETLGTMASTITSTFSSVGKLITASSYIAGLGFAVSAILKFKQHKDNPQQTPIGQPIGLVFIAAALLFLPSILEAAGGTIFSSTPKTATSTGTEIGGA
ncbi:MAG: type IV secretion protein IcmD [Legionellaceae bacterium]|nr:type IV secretion protein IcmD [Legionellaceae bacterium]